MKDLSVRVCSRGFSMRSCLTKYDCLGDERPLCVCHISPIMIGFRYERPSMIV